MTGKKHEPNIKTHSIGNSDTIKADYIGGSYTIQFDMNQVKQENFVRYYIENNEEYGVFFDTPKIPDDKNIGEHFVSDIASRVDDNINAFIVPHYLGDVFDDVSNFKIVYKQF